MHKRLTANQLLACVRDQQKEDWLGGKRIWAESYLQRHPSLREDPDYLLELVYGEIDLRLHLGEHPHLEEYKQRFPELADDLGGMLELHNAVESGGSFLSARETGALDEVVSPTEVFANSVGSQNGNGPSASAQLKVDGYKIRQEIGRGGMGVVYKAHDPKANRDVALKMLLDRALASPDQRRRFSTEFKVIAQFSHPNIVPVYHLYESGECVYYTMEFLPQTLRHRLQKAPPSIAQAGEWLETLARAVHYAHQHHIIHRDLKPENVLIGTDGKLRISDFGLAKDINEDSGKTPSGAIMGTARYMSPEQAKGESKWVGPAADIHALGVMLYEMLTGRTPFEDETLGDILQKIKKDCPIRPGRLRRSVPWDLETICLKCLRKDPRKRYATAEELADDLARFRSGRPILGRRASRTELAWRCCRQNPVAACLGFLLVLSLGATSLWNWTQYQDARRQSEDYLRREYANLKVFYEALPHLFKFISLKGHVTGEQHAEANQLCMKFCKLEEQMAGIPETPDTKRQWGLFYLIRAAVRINLNYELSKAGEFLERAQKIFTELATGTRVQEQQDEWNKYLKEVTKLSQQLGDLGNSVR